VYPREDGEGRCHADIEEPVNFSVYLLFHSIKTKIVGYVDEVWRIGNNAE
jgi:hypothetical protein